MQLELFPYPAITNWLELHARGTSEYDLIRWLREQHISLNGHTCWDLSEPVTLYQSHFEVMHALYQIRDFWRMNRQWELHITPMRLWLTPCAGDTPQGKSTTLSAPDKLRDFYLNRDNLTNISAESVADLLQQFLKQAQAATTAQESLQILGFSLHENPDWKAVRRRYRRLQSKHHPDKGGDADTSQRLNTAYQQLRDYFLRS